ncbi:unnamed protein product [Diatraea saccharalis]|uniref:DUF7869 domain-containing protein n=1 Tax=Diatraea saccharalis TaxID=40085 RepID=A0A9N9QWI0_9NEOP|nr:unnamed protein product [Diatraea saccharalis]
MSSSSDESVMNTSVDDQPAVKKKRGVRNKHLYKSQVQKSHRLHGEAYTSTSSGKYVEAKSNTGEECKCKKFCTLNFGVEERQDILLSLYNGRPKNEQDTFLMGLIKCSSVARRRSSNENRKKRDFTFTYFILSNAERIEVCRQAFSILYDIKNNAIFRLTTILSKGMQPQDRRGQHPNRGNSMPNDILLAIDEHIKSYPLKESHYSSKHVQYLDASLNVKIMYEMFCTKHPDLQDTVKYDFFRKLYNENYGFRFGRPQVDVCSTCEDLETKIKSPTLNDVAKRVHVVEKIVHLKRAKKFNSKQQEILALCKERADVGAIVFDYMQNLPIPKIPVQEMFYLRKLWLYVFCVHDLKSNTANFYTYHEGEAKRGPDEVCSLLWKTIQNIDPAVKVLHVFSDACGGQNRNNTLVRFFLILIYLGRFEKIHQYFPVRGHSFLQCDRNFGTAKRLIRKKDRIYTPDVYNDMISTAKKTGFSVTNITSEDILDFKKTWPLYYKKTSKSVDKASTFTISKYRHLTYSASHKGYLTAREYIDGLVKHHFLLQKNNVHPALPENKAYTASRIGLSNAGVNSLNLNNIAGVTSASLNNAGVSSIGLNNAGISGISVNNAGLVGAGIGSSSLAGVGVQNVAANAAVPVTGPFTATGNAELAVGGEFNAGGTAVIGGQIPVLGAVSFTGQIPASGVVSIAGNCGCSNVPL